MKLRTDAPGRRGGFTLIEMLVVISIIAILVALTVGAIDRVIQSRVQSNTEAGIAGITKALNQQWQAVIDQAQKEQIPSGVLTLADNNDRRARILFIKIRLK